MTRSLFHSRLLADRAIARIEDVEASALATERYAREPIDNFAPIVVPPLCAEAKREIRRGRNPLQTFRKVIRNLEIAAAQQTIKARKAFALSRCAVAWLPSH